MSTSRRSGATSLLEILIVIGIMAMLAGIVIAATAPARERGRRAVCVGNLHQIHRALMMYVSDWDGTDPHEGIAYRYADLGLPPDSGDAGWLEVYLRTRDVWRCPNDPKPRARFPRSYRVYFGEDGRLPDGYSIGERAAVCGGRTPLYDCPYHGLETGISTYLIVLRWNGSCKGLFAHLPPTVCQE